MRTIKKPFEIKGNNRNNRNNRNLVQACAHAYARARVRDPLPLLFPLISFSIFYDYSDYLDYLYI
jgi:hypothetical protein